MPSLSTNQRSVILPFIYKFCKKNCYFTSRSRRLLSRTFHRSNVLNILKEWHNQDRYKIRSLTSITEPHCLQPFSYFLSSDQSVSLSSILNYNHGQVEIKHATSRIEKLQEAAHRWQQDACNFRVHSINRKLWSNNILLILFSDEKRLMSSQ